MLIGIVFAPWERFWDFCKVQWFCLALRSEASFTASQPIYMHAILTSITCGHNAEPRPKFQGRRQQELFGWTSTDYISCPRAVVAIAMAPTRSLHGDIDERSTTWNSGGCEIFISMRRANTRPHFWRYIDWVATANEWETSMQAIRSIEQIQAESS